MRLRLLFIFLFFSSFSGFAQVVINELDTDTPGTDDREFIELRTETPNFPLDGYVLVFYNGTGSLANTSYYVIDLDGLTSDVNGICLLGNALVSPVPDFIFPNSVIQNGPDAIAVYEGNASDFPNNTTAHSNNLIDALAYDTSDEDATGLMNLLGLTEQIDENANGQGTTQSIQRTNSGGYEVKNPTPGVLNDGTGYVYNGVLATPSVASEIEEGQVLSVTFTTQQPVPSDLTFSISLTNGNFTTADYSGPEWVTITTGSTSVTVNYQIIDDSEDEGDEVLAIRFGTLPFGYKRLNDNIQLFVIDNDYTTAAWGTPLNPTYGQVSSTAPDGYYDTLEGKSGEELKNAIRDIIADPAIVRKHNYGDAELILRQADQNPLNSNQVWLMYVEQGRGKYKFQNTSSNVGSWNREHIFPQSRGGFSGGTSSTADGIDIWSATSADDINAGHADAHHIRAEDGPENTLRSNRDYGSDYNGPAGNQGSWKGDVARSLFYMAVRYNLLSLVNGNPPDTTMYQMGDLASLLLWNDQDPSDDFEMNRNNVVYTWQMNRNPFIDYPDLADYLWGEHAGEVWFADLSLADASRQQWHLYPNPSTGSFRISGLASGRIGVYGMAGNKLGDFAFADGQIVETGLSAGIYLIKITTSDASFTQKLIVR